jgi:DNA mismatch repair protein MutL
VRDSVADALRATRPITQVPRVARTTEQERGLAVDHRYTAPPIAPREPDPVRMEIESRFASTQSPISVDDDQKRNDQTSAANRFTAESNVRDLESCAAAPIDSVRFDGDAKPIEPVSLPGFGHGIKPLGQIRDSYIVATDEEGLLLVDQHVAHERVLFEQYRDDRLARAAGLQPLLIPVTIDLTPAEIEAFGIVKGEL